MKLLIFGTGDYYSRYKKWVQHEDILALLDNSSEKQGQVLDGYNVIAPDKISQYEYDYVVILSFYYADMKAQLIELGVEETRILHFYTLRRIIDWREHPVDIKKYESLVESHGDGEKILLLSPELNNGGPALALLHMAQVLIENSFQVTVASMIDGEIRDRFRELGAPVWIDNNLQLSTMAEEPWTAEFERVICNTLNYHVFLSDRIDKVPCIWWLHEPEHFYEGVDKSILQRVSKEKLQIVTVGNVPCNAIRKRLDVEPRNLLYQVKDFSVQSEAVSPSNRIKFLTVGFLEKLKGQDVLIDAIKSLPDSINDRAEFDIIGVDETLFGAEIKNRAKCQDNIKFLGVKNRKEIHNLYETCSAVICPSIEDSMPTVVTEAMMHSRPVIVSDAIGQSDFITDMHDGLVFPCGDVESLAQKIIWSVENPMEMYKIGCAGRKIYEDQFTDRVFANNMLDILKL